MNSNNALIKHLISSHVLKTTEIIDAFKAIDRADFVTGTQTNLCYIDNALPIGYGQTISQPTTVAIMLEMLQPKRGHHILDIGSGSGWTTALLAHIVGTSGFVYGVERVPELVEYGSKNLKNTYILNAQIMQARKVLGYPKKAPYDRILISAAAQKLPTQIIKQLKVGGLSVLPVKNSLVKVTKISDKKFDEENLCGFSFVPLIF